MPNIFDQIDPSTGSVAPDGKNPFDAFDGNIFDQFDEPVPPTFANLPGNIKLNPLQQAQMQSLSAGKGIDPENAGATLASLLKGTDDVFLQSVAPSIAAAAHALSDNPVTQGIGYGLNFAGRAIKGDAEAVLENLFGGKAGNDLANQQLLATAAEMNPKWKDAMEKEGIDTADPYEEARQTLPAAERMAAGVGPGLLQSAPQLALAAVQPELGAASFGFTPEGFDPVQAAAALIAPGGGKMIGGIAERLAARVGISHEQAFGVINRLGGGAGVAGLISAPAAYQIAQMKPGQERDAALQDAASNAILTGIMGSFAGHNEPSGGLDSEGAIQNPNLGASASEDLTSGGTGKPVSQKLDDLVASVKSLESAIRGNPFKSSTGSPESTPIATTDETSAGGTSQDNPALSGSVASEISQTRFGRAAEVPGSATATPTAQKPYYVHSPNGLGGLDDQATQAGVQNYLRRQSYVPPIQIINDPTWTHNGYGVRGTVQDGKIIINRAFIDSDDTLQKVLREEHNHSLLSSEEGRQAIRYAARNNIGLPQLADLSLKYPIQPGESVADYKLRLTDEFISKAASEQLPVWNQIVERVKGWLASKGIGELSDEETARAIVRALKAGKTAGEIVPALAPKARGPFEIPDSATDEFTEENSNLAARYNLTSKLVEGISRKEATKKIKQFFGTKRLPARFLVTRNRLLPQQAMSLRNGNIAVNATRISTQEEAPLAFLEAGLRDIWPGPDARAALRYVQSNLTSAELKAAIDRRKAEGLPTDSAAVREEAAIARVMNSDDRDRVVRNFYKAIGAALGKRFGSNLPATAFPQLKEATIQFLPNRNAPRAPDPAKAKPLRNVLTFKGMEVRAVRDLSHLKAGTLRKMARNGFAGTTKSGKPINLHHLAQNPKGPLVEMPGANNKISNIIQHPFGNTPEAGLSKAERIAHDAWRNEYWRWRAKQELAARRPVVNNYR